MDCNDLGNIILFACGILGVVLAVDKFAHKEFITPQENAEQFGEVIEERRR